MFCHWRDLLEASDQHVSGGIFAADAGGGVLISGGCRLLTAGYQYQLR